MLPSVTDSGLALVTRGERRLAESAGRFTRPVDREDAVAAEATAPDGTTPAAPATDGGGVDAAVGVVYGRTAFEIGLRLIAVGRDIEKALVDVLA